MSSSFVSASKSIGKLLSRQNNLGFLRRSTKSEVEKLFQVRCLSSIAGIESTPCIDKLIYADKKYEFLFGDLSSSNVQRRDFLSCGGGGGEGGNFLSKTYEEKRVLGYSPEQLFAVVSAVDLYQEFVPWCQRSEIIRRNDDGSFDAKLEIGFKFLVESYVSHVELIESKSVKSTVSESTLFDHLTNIWEFNPGPVPGSCNVHFFVDFKFQSPLYRQAASVFFKEVVSRLVGSFTDRCQVIYGPATPVVENSYGEDNL